MTRRDYQAGDMVYGGAIPVDYVGGVTKTEIRAGAFLTGAPCPSDPIINKRSPVGKLDPAEAFARSSAALAAQAALMEQVTERLKVIAAKVREMRAQQR